MGAFKILNRRVGEYLCAPGERDLRASGWPTLVDSNHRHVVTCAAASSKCERRGRTAVQVAAERPAAGTARARGCGHGGGGNGNGVGTDSAFIWDAVACYRYGSGNGNGVDDRAAAHGDDGAESRMLFKLLNRKHNEFLYCSAAAVARPASGGEGKGSSTRRYACTWVQGRGKEAVRDDTPMLWQIPGLAAVWLKPAAAAAGGGNGENSRGRGRGTTH